MSSQLTHERCSELLADYLARELDPEQHRLVEDHLEHCAQCSAERAGLSALISGRNEGLTGDERVALRAKVLGSTMAEDPPGARLDDESDAVVVPLGGRGGRAYKYLGVAALLAILGVASLFVLRGGDPGVSGDDSGDAGSAVETTEDSGEQAGGEDEEEAADAAPEQDRSAFELVPRFQRDRGALEAGDLDGLARNLLLARGETTSAFQSEDEDLNQNLRSKRAPEDQLQRLVARAPEELAPDIAECGQTALDELDQPGFAAYATTAALEGTDVVVLGFVTGDRAPDRYAVFAFPLDDCTTILTSTEGPLD